MGQRRAHYTKRTAAMICEQIALGKTLQQALDHVGYLAPSIPVLWRWLEEYPEFKDKYEQARQMSADMSADRMKELAEAVLKPENIRAANAYRVAMSMLQWEAEIRNSTRYGKKISEGKGRKAMDPAKIRAEIKRLEIELGIVENKVVPLKAVP